MAEPPGCADDERMDTQLLRDRHLADMLVSCTTQISLPVPVPADDMGGVWGRQTDI